MKHHDKAFFQLFGDSIWHAYQANDHYESRTIGAEKATRASIIASAIAFECASNCAIADIGTNKSFLNSIDKLDSLAKFELVAKINGKDFDSGNSRVAAMRELMTLRNSYVHPKLNKIPIEVSSIDETEEHQVVKLSLTGKKLMNLGIDKNSKFWYPNDAYKALKKCTDFYNWFFLECLELTESQIMGVLSPLLFLDDDKDEAMVIHQSCIEDELSLLEKIGITNKFLILESCGPSVGAGQ